MPDTVVRTVRLVLVLFKMPFESQGRFCRAHSQAQKGGLASPPDWGSGIPTSNHSSFLL